MCQFFAPGDPSHRCLAIRNTRTRAARAPAANAVQWLLRVVWLFGWLRHRLAFRPALRSTDDLLLNAFICSVDAKYLCTSSTASACVVHRRRYLTVRTVDLLAVSGQRKRAKGGRWRRACQHFAGVCVD